MSCLEVYPAESGKSYLHLFCDGKHRPDLWTLIRSKRMNSKLTHTPVLEQGEFAAPLTEMSLYWYDDDTDPSATDVKV